MGIRLLGTTCAKQKARYVFVLILISFCALASKLVNAGEDRTQAWELLKSGGHVVLLRHALAPGFGDPDNFTVDDCTTQRNLSSEGQTQAKRIGQLFKDQGFKKARVYSSQWCRCLDTAELLSLGSLTEAPFLNSFFSFRERRQTQMDQTRDWLRQNYPIAKDDVDRDGPIVLVTHQVNITALTGIFPNSGELVIAKLDSAEELEAVATIETL